MIFAKVLGLFCDFAIRIKSIYSLKDADNLQKMMIRKYCLLVTNHSLAGYSPLIQRVINHIDMKLSEPLSLRLLSDLFSINASYNTEHCITGWYLRCKLFYKGI